MNSLLRVAALILPFGLTAFASAPIAASGVAATVDTAALEKDPWAFIPDPVATVDDRSISRERLVKSLEAQAARVRDTGRGELSAADRKLLAKRMTDELIRATVLEILAAKDGFPPTPALGEEEYKRVSGQFSKNLPPGETFETFLARQGMTVDEVKKSMAVSRAIDLWTEKKVKPTIDVPEKAVLAFYQENKDTFFAVPDRYRVSHILIRPERGATDQAAANAAAKAKAEKLLKALRAGADFAEMAKAHSVCPSGQKKGGDLGYQTRRDMLKSFGDAAAALKPGETSEVVETTVGFHIIRLIDHQPATHQDFNAVKDGIRDHLRKIKLAETIRTMISTYRDEHPPRNRMNDLQ